MRVGKAGIADIGELTELRLEYLAEDHGSLEDTDAERIRNALPGYFREHLNKDLYAYVIRENGIIVSCAFLLTVLKPMSPAFINGKTATVLNVFTRRAYRRRGYARKIMDALIADAEKQEIAPVPAAEQKPEEELPVESVPEEPAPMSEAPDEPSEPVSESEESAASGETGEKKSLFQRIL